MDIRLARRLYGVTLERTIRELRGEACFALEEGTGAKQQLVVSRSFGSRVTQLAQMQQAVTKYATRAGEKLRQENRLAKVVTVFIRSSAYDAGGVPYSNQATEVLPVPSQDTRDIRLSAKCLQQIIANESQSRLQILQQQTHAKVRFTLLATACGCFIAGAGGMAALLSQIW
ncbi:hypothetical protein QDT85_004242 [Escherichia coli]